MKQQHLSGKQIIQQKRMEAALKEATENMKVLQEKFYVGESTSAKLKVQMKIAADSTVYIDPNKGTVEFSDAVKNSVPEWLRIKLVSDMIQSVNQILNQHGKDMKLANEPMIRTAKELGHKVASARQPSETTEENSGMTEGVIEEELATA